MRACSGCSSSAGVPEPIDAMVDEKCGEQGTDDGVVWGSHVGRPEATGRRKRNLGQRAVVITVLVSDLSVFISPAVLVPTMPISHCRDGVTFFTFLSR